MNCNLDPLMRLSILTIIMLVYTNLCEDFVKRAIHQFSFFNFYPSLAVAIRVILKY